MEFERMKKLTGFAALTLSLALSSQAAWAACTPEDLQAKSTEISAEVQKMTPNLGKTVDVNEYSTESQKLQQAGQAIADGDMDRACSLYDEFLTWAKAQN